MRTSAPHGAAALLALALTLAVVRPGAAEDYVTRAQLEAVEQRIEELERQRDRLRRGGGSRSEWTDRIRLSGIADVFFFGRGDDTILSDDSFYVWDARLFLDADLARDVRVGSRTLIRNVGLTFEWNLVRLGELENDVGDLYVDFQGLGESSWFNLQLGRFQIPVGEGYLRYGKGYANNPFVTNPVGAPWWWDEGVRLYGTDTESRFGYVLSVTDGETPFNTDGDNAKQVTLKLFGRPLPWLYVSASYLRSGKMGSESMPALGALWLGESWARAFGSGTEVPNFVDGVAVPDGPFQLEGSTFYGADVVLEKRDVARLWLGYGRYAIDSKGETFYDRTLAYWIAELILEGDLVSPELGSFYLALRANGLGTRRQDRGYLLDSRYASLLGYNMRHLNAYSVALGWRISHLATLLLEYTFQDIGLVRGVPDALSAAARDTDYVGVGMRAHF